MDNCPIREERKKDTISLKDLSIADLCGLYELLKVNTMKEILGVELEKRIDNIKELTEGE